MNLPHERTFLSQVPISYAIKSVPGLQAYVFGLIPTVRCLSSLVNLALSENDILRVFEIPAED
jgi:hypothetical protein